MNLPIQSEPVQRTIASQPFAGGIAGTRQCGGGVAPSQHGVDASSLADLFDSLRSQILTTVPTTLPTFGI